MKFKLFNKENKIDVEDNDLESSIEDKESNEGKFVFLPTNFVVGYYEGMTQKGLKEYISGYVFKYFNAPNVTYYKMIKYNAGYIFEIHDGDSSTSYLKQIINEFNSGNTTVYVKLQSRTAKVNKNLSKITTYLLPESETDICENKIIPEKSKMKPIQGSGFGFVSFGIALAVLGVTSLFLSSLFKTILNKNETISIQKQIIEDPVSFIEKLPVATETRYISKVSFENGKWNKVEKEIKTEEMITAEKNNMLVVKLEGYTKFVKRCVSKSPIKECNDSNPFLDKLNINEFNGVEDITIKEGVIKVDFKNKDFISLIPDFSNESLIWSYSCSNSELANICKLPNTKIDKVNKLENDLVKDIKIEKSKEVELKIIKEDVKEDIKETVIKRPIDVIVKKSQPIVEIKKEMPINKLKNTVEDLNKVISEPFIENVEDFKVNQVNKDIPKNLDLSEIPNNIIVE